MKAFPVISLCFVQCLLIFPRVSEASQTLRGIIVISTRWAVRNGDFARSLSVPGVDGALVELDWNQLEPRRGAYDWTALDTLIAPLAKNGQWSEVSIWTGNSTPQWLFQPPPQGAGAKQLSFEYSAHRGGGIERNVVLAAPWDRAYLGEFDEFLSHLADHLKEAGEDSLVPAIRLTGINATTDELRLPAQTPEMIANPTATDSVKTWIEAGYRPALIRAAWKTIAASFARHFPQKTFTLALIPNGAFPGIDELGRPPSRPMINRENSAALNSELVQIASEQFPSHLIIEHLQLFSNVPADAQIIAFANRIKSPAAWQTNLFLGREEKGAAAGGTISDPEPLTGTLFGELLDRGIHPKGFSGDVPFIEVAPSDVIAFPAIIQKAHDALQAH